MDKSAFVETELGFDAAVDHRLDRFPSDLRVTCSDSSDVYFEKVASKAKDGVLPFLNQLAHVPV
ncbi:hypothetical protein RMR21_024175 (plasmid) [Agrobacterium sp. rho-8.1]|nr:hypothetical protein [Agrobacterium sp. rho-8.1]